MQCALVFPGEASVSRVACKFLAGSAPSVRLKIGMRNSLEGGMSYNCSHEITVKRSPIKCNESKLTESSQVLVVE